MQVNNWLYFIQSLCFPHHCVLCGTTLGGAQEICHDCLLGLPFNRQPCPRCALPLAVADGSLCGHCLARRPPYAASRVPLLYQPPVDCLIGSLKFARQLHLSALLSELFCDRLSPGEAMPDLIVPVPLHPARLRQRGFNQSLEIARRVAAELALPLDWRSCRRIRATPPQSGLDRRTRGKNLNAAFIADGRLAGRHLALFDDVVTTGATVTAVTRALLRAGVGRVDVWALARTPGP